MGWLSKVTVGRIAERYLTNKEDSAQVGSMINNMAVSALYERYIERCRLTAQKKKHKGINLRKMRLRYNEMGIT